ncbi:FecR family protein [Mucilaginibacter mali]|uniref:FecR family protein n=1 Tax=Mucilaginibacter mali TaxID=2740462 RepID=A0A7D4QD39_9SPHI|nr:FecR domain-containing protein [Mucilaginibacter mali]QKJ32805.1 FecR family protein [Mucilaginibacter mali]
MSKKYNAEELLVKYAEGTCTDEELAMLENWYLQTPPISDKVTPEAVAAAKEDIWAKLPVHHNTQAKVIKLNPGLRILYKIAVAASVILILGVGYWLLKSPDSIQVAKNENPLVVPGSQKATLTLANGKQIAINRSKKGLVANTEGASIVKTGDGKIAYQAEETAVSWNTLSIPAGGYFAVTLSDGTRVWLNSRSSLKYPTRFTGNERNVILTGEGYFEVAHDKAHPFTVTTDKQKVEVLGTHFNINAYTDEDATTTTLLEGSVKVTNANSISKLLKPQQAATVAGNDILINNCNAENAIDWVSNDFVFANKDLDAIMRKISRWYDVDVSCPKRLEDLQFSGSISRTKNIQQVLEIMESTGMVKFKLEGRRVTVMQ